MSNIVNHPSFIAAALARREEILAECERARLAASARPATARARRLMAIRERCGAALIRLGARISPPTQLPAPPEHPPARST